MAAASSGLRKANRVAPLISHLGIGRAIERLVGAAELAVAVAVKRIQFDGTSRDGDGLFVPPTTARNQRQSHVHRCQAIVDLQRLPAAVDGAVDPQRVFVRLVFPPIRLAKPGMCERILIIDAGGACKAFDCQIDILGAIEA
jgi:hypothetical protein